MEADIRIIKRYQNRKLYDTFQSSYVTLEEIAKIVRNGHEIQVIDNKTKKDITYITQIQLLFDQERKTINPEDTELLKKVIRSAPGTLTGYIKMIDSGIQPQVLEANSDQMGPNLSNFSESVDVDTIVNSIEKNQNVHGEPNSLN